MRRSSSAPDRRFSLSSRAGRRGRLTLAGLLLGALLLVIGPVRPARADPPTVTPDGLVRVGAAPRVPAGATALGPVPATAPVRITVALTPRDPSALAAYAASVATPGSDVYHHYLSVPEFAARFGAGPSQVAAVQAALRSVGLSPSPP